MLKRKDMPCATLFGDEEALPRHPVAKEKAKVAPTQPADPGARLPEARPGKNKPSAVPAPTSRT